MSTFGIDIDEDHVCLFGKHTSKIQALEALTEAISVNGAVTDPGAVGRAVLAREESLSTGIGDGIAIPHVRHDAVQRATVAVGVSRAGIEFDAIDKRPVNIIVLFIVPADANTLYLKLLAQVMVALKTPGFRKRLMACNTAAKVVRVLSQPAAEPGRKGAKE